MVNYIRINNVESPLTITESDGQLWMDDKFMKPVEVEPWLMYG